VKIALFGGTFDPIHNGHLRAAEAAARRFRLDRVLFIPSGHPPHKTRDHLTPFAHRLNMVALACAGHPRFVPSLLETPRADGRPHYSIETVRRVRRTLGARDRLYFLIGIDAFQDLPEWKQYRHLLELVDFIVVSRPGYSDSMIAGTLPPELRRGAQRGRRHSIPLQRGTLHILRGLYVPASSSAIRRAVAAGRRVSGIVPPLVEEYIRKEELYLSRSSASGRL
jgi:nicotinate-nucleotide adenylyltransferase